MKQFRTANTAVNFWFDDFGHGYGAIGTGAFPPDLACQLGYLDDLEDLGRQLLAYVAAQRIAYTMDHNVVLP